MTEEDWAAIVPGALMIAILTALAWNLILLGVLHIKAAYGPKKLTERQAEKLVRIFPRLIYFGAVIGAALIPTARGAASWFLLAQVALFFIWALKLQFQLEKENPKESDD